jgi:hypothetical protein
MRGITKKKLGLYLIAKVELHLIATSTEGDSAQSSHHFSMNVTLFMGKR